MKIRILFILHFVFLFCVNRYHGLNIDSLKKIISGSKDKSAVEAYNLLGKHYLYIDGDSAFKYTKAGLEFAKKNCTKYAQACFFINLGNHFVQKDEYNDALYNYIEAEKIYIEEKRTLDIGVITMNIGMVYEYQNLPAKALEKYEAALKIALELKDRNLEANTYNAIGSIYYSLNNKAKALDYFTHSLKINQEENNTEKIMEGLNNVAIVYQELGKFEEALDYLKQALCYQRKMDSKAEIVSALHNIGLVYMTQKNYPKAIAYVDSSIILGKQIKDFAKLQEIYYTISEIYKILNDAEKSFEYFKLSVASKDSVIKKTRDKHFIEMSTKYDTEKKEAENKLLKLEGEKQRTVLMAISGGLILVAALAFVAYTSARQRKKANVLLSRQNNEIRTQKHIIEEKQKEILDSISYAKRLQDAILPPQDYINKYFPQNFVLYKPKDIVAGDFYWMEHIDDLSFLASADSTGHGVPGAMVSVVCSNALNRSLKEFGLRKTGEILDKTRELVLETFTKGSADVKDGMDISLIAVDKTNRKVFWSGANNPLWYITTTLNEQGEEMRYFHELKADKQAIGKTENPKPFVTHEIDYKENTVFYLFTDGYPDQFGGPKGKKYKYKQLEEHLQKNCHLSLHEQKFALISSFNEWIGKLEQVDDVSIIGIQI